MPTRVRVLHKRAIDIELFDGSRRVIRVLYQAEGLPPRVIWVDEDKATPENIKKLIAADLKVNVGMMEEEVEIVE